MNTMHPNTKQMAKEFSRLFFLCNQHQESGLTDELQQNVNKRDYLLKELKGSGYDVTNLVARLKTKLLFQPIYDTIIVFTDGGLRNNHLRHEMNIGASSFIIYGNNQKLFHKANYFGTHLSLPSGELAPADTLLAEYHGLLKAFHFIAQHRIQAKRFIFLSDSSSMVDHVSSKGLPRNACFQDFALHLRKKFEAIPNAEIRHIPRAQNKVADRYVNQILDSKGDYKHATNKR